MALAERLSEYIRACFTGIWITSHEQQEALAEISRLCSTHNWRLASWDLEQGLQLAGAAAPESSGTGDPLAALRALPALGSPEGTALLVLPNFHRFLNSPEIVQALIQQILTGKQQRTFVVNRLRQRIASQLSGVQSVLDGLLVDRPRRNILRGPRPEGE